MYDIDIMVCSSNYWLALYKRNRCWQFSLYFPEQKVYCNTDDLCYSTRLVCLNSGKQVAEEFLRKIAEMQLYREHEKIIK